MQLSKRLLAVAKLVTPGNRVADIGCDHAYTSIYLIQEKLSPHIIAMDVNQGPLDRAISNINTYGYSRQIDVRKSNGLEKLSPGEVDTILIAGMGGLTTIGILSARMDVLKTAKELILQPQSEIHLVRKAVCDYGFVITNEEMIKEDGKYYVCFKAQAEAFVADRSDYELTKEEHFHFGRCLLQAQNSILYEFLKKEHNLCSHIYDTLLATPTSQSIARQKEILHKMELIDIGLSYYHSAI